MNHSVQPAPSAFDYASLVLALMALAGLLKFNLLVAMLVACATYALTMALPDTWLFRRLGQRAPVVASLAVATIPVLALVAVGLGISYLNGHAQAANADMMKELGRIIAEWRDKLPLALTPYLPEGPETLKPWLVHIAKGQAANLTDFGKSGAHGLLMALVGIVIGLLLANANKIKNKAPLSKAIAQRASRLQQTFSTIVVAQFWIASINTALTALFFYAVVPAFDVKMPYAPYLLVLTFVAGMLPVAGNLVCNTVTALVALSVGPTVAVAALVFLIFVHKLEYAINAKVVGSRMNMAAWELLTAMFVLDAIFGISGLVAAPFFYAYCKRELRDLGWV